MDSIESVLQPCLHRLEHWADISGFRFFASKTVRIHFSRLRTHSREPSLYKTPLSVVQEFNFVWLIFDNKLIYDKHIL